uniref:Uncharacterized protein n=1 Tax=Glossina pallidipes TaxID=7398 RepID=A0A1B0AA80_GLOPL
MTIFLVRPAQSVTSFTTSKRPSAKADISGFTFVKLILGAIFPVSNAKQVLISEHTPAAASVWPKFDLTEPTNRANCNVTNGCKHKFAPPTIAASISPLRKAVNALSKAYIELEQAVSNKNEGPSKPKLYEMRFGNIARLQPVTPKPPLEETGQVRKLLIRKRERPRKTDVNSQQPKIKDKIEECVNNYPGEPTVYASTTKRTGTIFVSRSVRGQYSIVPCGYKEIKEECKVRVVTAHKRVHVHFVQATDRSVKFSTGEENLQGMNVITMSSAIHNVFKSTI